MVDSALMETVAVAADDVEVWMAEPNKCEIAVGPRTFALAAAPAALKSLTDVISQVVPRMQRSVPVGRQLSDAEADRLAPFVERFREMGILLFPEGGVVIDDEAGRRLYSYICRRATEPDRVFAELRAKRIHLTGPERVVAAWAHLLREQGLVASGREPAADAALNVVIAADETRLAEANRALCADRTAWVPVLFAAQHVRIGPWVRVGESGCLRCHLPANLAPERAPDQAPDSAAVPAAERPRRPCGSTAGWATLQPGCLHWTGGLVAHLALRALLPPGAEHPWGRVTRVDATTGAQTSLTTWRDPFCPDCARHAPAAQEWVAL